MPSVTMNEGSVHRTTIRPLAAPHARPVSRHRTTPPARGAPQLTTAMPSTAPDKAITEPTDRSIPAMINTNVIPTAAMVTSATWLARVRKVACVRKLSAERPKTTISVTRAIVMPR